MREDQAVRRRTSLSNQEEKLTKMQSSINNYDPIEIYSKRRWKEILRLVG